MAKAIAEREKLIIATPHPEEVEAMLYPCLSEKAKENTKIALCPSNDTWARDHAPITLRNRENGELKMLDFKFNGWGEKFAADKDNEIGRRLKADNILTAEMEDNLDFVLEGGAIESDGKGTIFTTSQCLMCFPYAYYWFKFICKCRFYFFIYCFICFCKILSSFRMSYYYIFNTY